MSSKELTLEHVLDLYFITNKVLRRVCEAYVKAVHPQITTPNKFKNNVSNVRKEFFISALSDTTWLSEEMKDMVRHLENIE